jgi:hypothetical protein
MEILKYFSSNHNLNTKFKGLGKIVLREKYLLSPYS